jgi:hypothetical protein
MQAPQEKSTELMPLVCGSASGLLLAGLLLATGIVQITRGLPLLIGSGEHPQTAAGRSLSP